MAEDLVRIEYDREQLIRTIRETIGGEERHAQVMVIYGTKSDGSLEAINTDDSGKIKVVFA